MTHYEYDDEGRLCRSVTAQESEWSQGDVDALIASRRAAQAPRGQHGRLLSEATDPALSDRWEVPLPKRDFAAAKLHAAQAKRRKDYPSEDASALLWTVRPIEG